MMQERPELSGGREKVPVFVSEAGNGELPAEFQVLALI